ncbi:hypothetical protein D3C72_1842540 [compost metagenome]
MNRSRNKRSGNFRTRSVFSIQDEKLAIRFIEGSARKSSPRSLSVVSVFWRSRNESWPLGSCLTLIIEKTIEQSGLLSRKSFCFSSFVGSVQRSSPSRMAIKSPEAASKRRRKLPEMPTLDSSLMSRTSIG